jgi:hypothetical protein
MRGVLFSVLSLLFMVSASFGTDFGEGSRAKIVTRSGAEYTGIIRSVGDTSVTIVIPRYGDCEIQKDDIDLISARESNVKRGAALGITAGVGIGVLWYFLSRQDDEGFFESEIRVHEHVHVQRTVILGIAGGLVGAALGAALEDWTPIDKEKLAVTANSVYRDGCGLQLTFRF